MKLFFASLVILLVTDVCTAGTRARPRRNLPGPFIKIDIRSEGCNDPGKAPDTCGIAYIKVNGKDHSPRRRGHNVVIVDAVTGNVLDAKSFDTHGNSAAGNQLRDYLNSIVGDKLVLVAIQDEGSRHVGAAFDALKRVGATDPILTDFRGSYALVGYARVKKPSYVKQEQRNNGKGPSVISITVPLTTNPFVDIDVRSEGCDDPGKAPNTCGIAYIKVDGKDYSLHGRGHNVVVVDSRTAAVLEAKKFDTHGDGSAGTQLTEYLDKQRGNKIILVAVQDSGSSHVGVALNALKRVGAADPILVDFRGSFALIGTADTNKPAWIAQDQHPRYKGPSVISRRIPLTLDPFIDVDVRSEGCDDPGKAPNTCGIAYIKVDGKDHSLHRRGHNVVILDGTTGAVLGTKSFDTHGDGAAGNNLRDYLNAQNGNKIVLVSVQDSASSHVGAALNALKRVGAADPILVDFRGSFALIGSADSHKPTWIAQDQHPRYKGPSVISRRIPLPPIKLCHGALGMENYAIPNGQVKASSEWDGNHAAIQGRLQYKAIPGKAGSWSARSNDVNQWLQVDLGNEFTKVTGVASQGRNGANQWVTKYKLQYSNDGVHFQYYWEEGQGAEKVFDGNVDQNTVVFHGLSPPIKARYIRIRPMNWQGHISMRVEFYGCPGCQDALGMTNYAIPNGQVKASTEWDGNHAAIQGRLYYKAIPGKAGSWSARNNDVNQWLQVDLGNEFTRVTGVASQGRNGANQWVTKYKLQYSSDGVSFKYYRDAGQGADREFAGNADQNTVVYHGFNSPIKARYIRFRPLTWHGHISMRVDLYGCSACEHAVGMANYAIPNGQVKASSEWDSNHAAIQGRLYYKAIPGKAGSWSARNNDVNQWLQVDLGEFIRVTGVASQGRNGANQWVTKYKLQYSSDGVTFKYYMEAAVKEFAANQDQNTVVYHLLHPPVVTRYIRFRPVTWHGHISMRVEVYGCSVSNQCAPNPCKNGATCSNVEGGYRCACKPGFSGTNCDQDINECTNNPCKNGATCVNLQGSHRCDCKSGFTGSTCEVDINECSNNPCKNGAACVNTQGSYRCNCKSGFSGTNCEADINECSNNPCKNGANCVNLHGSYRCDCKSGFTGDNCETDVNECANNPCKHGASCVNLPGGHRCDCVAGYSGSSCQTDINECAPAPCLNGGTCVDLVGNFRCDCAAGWLGNTCAEPELDECQE